MVNANDGYGSCKQFSSRLDTLWVDVNWDVPTKPDDLYIAFHTQWDLKDNYTTETTELSFFISTYGYDNPWVTISTFRDFTPGQNKIDRWDKVGIIHALAFLNYSIEVTLADDHYLFGCTFYDRRIGWW
ncbi:24605_t:CDS:1, partial [Gigaspora rosea]